MATVNKNFKIKSGLVVEGTTGTINGEDILTKSQDDIDYIIDQVGGSGVSTNTPNTLVLRDGSGNFAAGQITADLIGDVDGNAETVTSLSGHTTDEIAEGTSNEYYTDAKVRDVLTGSTQTNITITEVGNELHITAENGVADSTTDDLTEGTTNKYFTDARARDAITDGDGISYNSVNGQISADIVSGAGLKITAGAIDLDRNVIDDWYDASGSATTAYNDAVAAAASDATTKANNAESAANSYTDDEITAALVTAQGYADTAESNANAYTDNAVSGLNWKQAVNLLYDAAIPVLSGSGATQLAVDGHAALGDADSGYRLLLTGVTSPGIYVYNSTGGSWTLTRSEDADAFGELIGAAVYVMEGTQYGSTSWVQSNHYITDFTGQSWTQFSGQGSVTAGNGIVVDGLEVSIDTNVVATQSDLSTGLGGKQDTLTAGTNIDITNNTVSVTGLASTDISDFNTAALSATASAYDTAGSAFDAQQNAEAYTEAQLTNYTTTANLETTVDGYGFAYTSELPTSTDDVPEGVTNHYYTDARAKAEAAALLTNATKTNITITADGNNDLTITAEGGVGDATTDDLVEGNSNLYFTDVRAVDAITNSDIQPTTVEINDYRKEEATRVNASSETTVNLHSFEYPFESAKYLVRVVGWVGGVKHSQLTEILITTDGNNNIAITEYGTICTNSTNIASFTATEAAGVFTLTGTTAVVSNCEIITAATLLSWAD